MSVSRTLQNVCRMDSERADQSQGALGNLGHLSLPGQLRVWRLDAVAPCLNGVEMLEAPVCDARRGAQCCAPSSGGWTLLIK